jgi:putative membrane protein
MTGRLIAVVCVAVACSGQHADANRANSAGDSAGSAASTGEVTPSSHATASTITDANILGELSEANQAEIAAGQMALQRAQSGEVRRFARGMVSDHTKMLNAGKALADSLSITPAPPSPDSLPQKADQETQTLSASTGAAFDKSYMAAQVADHRMVLELLRNLEAAAQNPRVKALITGALATVQSHLDRAQVLDGKVRTTA